MHVLNRMHFHGIQETYNHVSAGSIFCVEEETYWMVYRKLVLLFNSFNSPHQLKIKLII